MKIVKSGLLGLMALAFATPTWAEEVPMTEDNWTLRGTSEFVEFQGAQAVFLNHGLAVLNDREFENGVIEFDIAFSEIRGFMGINFRVQDSANYENFYFRSHQSGNVDANQYTPSFNSLTGWQIYFGPQYSTAIDYNFDTWQHVKILVNGDKAEFYLDSDTPFLHVDNLLQENTSGIMSISSLFTGAYFANFSFVEDDSVVLIGSPVAFEAWPENLVTPWQVATSTVLAETLSQTYWLGEEQIGAIEWTKLDVEANGVANLARVNGISEDGNTVFVRMVITSDKAQVKHLRYGFSDRVKAYVNGKLVAGGNDTYQTRDYRYLGTVGLYDDLYLHLSEGRNEVVFAVTEAFGGWAIVGAFDDMEGISIE